MIELDLSELSVVHFENNSELDEGADCADEHLLAEFLDSRVHHEVIELSHSCNRTEAPESDAHYEEGVIGWNVDEVLAEEVVHVDQQQQAAEKYSAAESRERRAQLPSENAPALRVEQLDPVSYKWAVFDSYFLVGIVLVGGPVEEMDICHSHLDVGEVDSEGVGSEEVEEIVVPPALFEVRQPGG